MFQINLELIINYKCHNIVHKFKYFQFAFLIKSTRDPDFTEMQFRTSGKNINIVKMPINRQVWQAYLPSYKMYSYNSQKMYC